LSRETAVADSRAARGRRTPLVDPLLTVVMPVYNESATVEEMVGRVLAMPLRIELIAVDDASTDGSREILERLAAQKGFRVLLQERNLGKGAAVRRGFGEATGDVIVIQDADLEYDPVDIPELVAPIRSGVADAVFGSRLIGGRPQRAHLFWHKVGNRALSLLTNVLYNTTLSDMETGYKAFTLEVLRSIEPLYESDFRIEPELTAKICRGGFRIYEVPIAYYGRSYDEGKKITWRDGFPAVYALVKYRFKDR
jgi:glycosyltransferase involved in cell wall biosynthesis